MSDSAVEKADLARANTTQGTATLADDKPAETDGHNGDSSKVAKFNTMVDTAEEGKALLAGEDFGGTRQETTKKRQSRQSTNKRLSTVDKVLEEAKAVYTDLDTSSEGRSLRKRAAPPPAKEATPPVKRTSTMARTAKEGEEFVKGTPTPKAKKSTTPKKASAKKGKGKGKGRGRNSKGAAEDEEEEEEMEAGEDGEQAKDDAAAADGAAVTAATNDNAAAAPTEEKKEAAAAVVEDKSANASGETADAAVQDNGVPAAAAPAASAPAAVDSAAADVAATKDAIAEVVATSGDS